MTDLPAGAITDQMVDTAMAKIPDQHISLGHWEPGVDRKYMRAALEAVAPAILGQAAAQLKAATADEIMQICTETVLEAVAAERRRWAAKFRDMAAAVLPRVGPGGISFAELDARDPNSRQQEQGRLLLNLADLLDPSGRPQPVSDETDWRQATRIAVTRARQTIEEATDAALGVFDVSAREQVAADILSTVQDCLDDIDQTIPPDDDQPQPVRSVAHKCPPDGGDGLTPCCGAAPPELPHTDRLTLNPLEVTCAHAHPPAETNWLQPSATPPRRE